MSPDPPSLPPVAAPGTPATSATNLPIALRKGKSPTYQAYSASLHLFLSLILIEFPSASGMEDGDGQRDVSSHFKGDMGACGAPPNADVVACRWVFTLKFRADGTLDRYTACLVAKGITQTYGSLRAWFDKFSRIIGEFGFSRCQADHSVFVQTTGSGMVILAVYVDDILTGSDAVGIEEAKTYLRKHFVTKALGRPRYFLEIEIAHSKHGVSLSKRKYACDLLQEASLLGTKPVDTSMDSKPDFWNDDGNYLEDKTKYRRLVGKLIYLTVTRPDISFAVSLVSQFMDKP
ncbi:UNVERIFIED_CONTAM: Retrovirus-related Pol polyprotein from transposon RE2 [Sesamum radiatum]|uniref:Retrovirus-related Pol polyprotein from transposon RE2 n=1 Tax=Sesamum radiatum TaxID=300843 RepID=A0AAW2Q2H8_SESRA